MNERETLIEAAKQFLDTAARQTKYYPRMDNSQQNDLLADFAAEQIAAEVKAERERVAGEFRRRFPDYLGMASGDKTFLEWLQGDDNPGPSRP